MSAKITSVSVLFFVDSLRQMVDSVLGASLPSKFVLSGLNGEEVATFAAGDGVAMTKGVTLDLDELESTLFEIEFNKVAGKLQLPGLTTTGLPQNRQYWQSFGQLFEDVYLGRIPELLTAAYLIVDQTAQKLYWSGISNSWLTDDGTPCFSGNDNKAGADFFEA